MTRLLAILGCLCLAGCAVHTPGDSSVWLSPRALCGFGERFSDGPLQNKNPSKNCFAADTCLSRYFGYRQHFSVEREALCIPLVVLLGDCVRPTAILRRVVAVDILPFNSQIPWTFSHIGQKVCEGCEPAFANFNPASAVINEMRVVGVEAPLFHRVVTKPCGSFRLSVSRESNASRFFLQASATRSVSILEAASQNIFFFAALASTHPPSVRRVAIGHSAYYRQAAEARSGKILESGHV